MVKNKQFTNGQISEINKCRRTPCVSDCGECYIVSALCISFDGEEVELLGSKDVNVFATEVEASKWIAKQVNQLDHACSFYKTSYTVRNHFVY